LITEISLPSSYRNENDQVDELKADPASNMHIGGFNFLQQNKSSGESSEVVNGFGILKESNKSSTSDQLKLNNRKHKFGHVNKSFEPSHAYGNF
jgi:hypothetical protein